MPKVDSKRHPRLNPRAYDFSNLQLLVLEPSSYFRDLLISMLWKFGFHEIYQAETQEEAYGMLRAKRVDMLLTELALDSKGIGRGVSFVEQVRRSEEIENPMLPIVAITGHAERDEVLAARDAGITEFLAKPVSPEKLFHRIAVAIDSPRTFVRAPGYVGPDRRRFVHFEYEGEERRGEGEDTATFHAPDPDGRLARAARQDPLRQKDRKDRGERHHG